MKKCYKRYILITIPVLVLFGIVSLCNNKYYRTTIFRTFVKGCWYITSEQDTIYSMGFFGIRKMLKNDTGLYLLSEQDSFCKNTLIARSAVIKGNVIYVLCRSWLSGLNTLEDANYNNGALVVLDKHSLTVRNYIKSDIKYVEGDYENDKLVVTGLLGYDIYDISNEIAPTLIYSYRHPTPKEFHGLDVYIHKDSCYVAMATYGSGFEIWNITNIDSPHIVRSVSMNDITDKLGRSCKGNMVFDLVEDYPYLYTTIAPLNNTYGKSNDIRGAVIYNIETNKANAIEIPKEHWYSVNTGDKEPTFIVKYGNKLLTNFADKGVALFKTDNKGNLVYLHTDDAGNNGFPIQPIYITSDGILLSGNYWWSKIYYSNYFDNIK